MRLLCVLNLESLSLAVSCSNVVTSTRQILWQLSRTVPPTHIPSCRIMAQIERARRLNGHDAVEAPSVGSIYTGSRAQQIDRAGLHLSTARQWFPGISLYPVSNSCYNHRNGGLQSLQSNEEKMSTAPSRMSQSSMLLVQLL